MILVMACNTTSLVVSNKQPSGTASSVEDIATCEHRSDSWVTELPGFSSSAQLVVSTSDNRALVFENYYYQIIDTETGKPLTPEPIEIGQQLHIDKGFYNDYDENFLFIGKQSEKQFFLANLLDYTGKEGIYQAVRRRQITAVSTSLNEEYGLMFAVYTPKENNTEQVRLSYSKFSGGKWNRTVTNGVVALALECYKETNGNITCVRVDQLEGYDKLEVKVNDKLQYGINSRPFNQYAMLLHPKNNNIIHAFFQDDKLIISMDTELKELYETDAVKDSRLTLHNFNNVETDQYFLFDGFEAWTFSLPSKATCVVKLDQSSVLEKGFKNIDVAPLGGPEDDYIGTAFDDKLYIRRIVVK